MFLFCAIDDVTPFLMEISAPFEERGDYVIHKNPGIVHSSIVIIYEHVRSFFISGQLGTR